MTGVTGQVNQEIWSEEDLLAIDSAIQNEVIVAPPPPSSQTQFTVPAPVETVSNDLLDTDFKQSYNPQDGSHSFSYILPDGTKHTQSGYFTPEGYVMTGSWEYFDANGRLFRTEFTADKDGYRPRIIDQNNLVSQRRGRKLVQNKRSRKTRKLSKKKLY